MDSSLTTIDKPLSNHGGARPGAGRPFGTQWASTIEKKAAKRAFDQRVLKNTSKLFNAQLTRALGSVQIFRVDETEDRNGKVVKTEHVLITDPDEIKDVLDTGEGVNCSVNGAFYLVTEIPPETKAVDSLLDRTWGKATQHVELETKDSESGILEQLKGIVGLLCEQMDVNTAKVKALELICDGAPGDLLAEIEAVRESFLAEVNG